MSNTVAAETVKEQRFMEWMKTYGDIILRTCFVYLPNLHDAQDATQDTFLKAWKEWINLKNEMVQAKKPG